jgi:hypothetical protein
VRCQKILQVEQNTHQQQTYLSGTACMKKQLVDSADRCTCQYRTQRSQTAQCARFGHCTCLLDSLYKHFDCSDRNTYQLDTMEKVFHHFQRHMCQEQLLHRHRYQQRPSTGQECILGSCFQISARLDSWLCLYKRQSRKRKNVSKR